MKAYHFPDFVHRLPEADLPIAGVQGWIVQSESGQVLFIESEVEFTVPDHSHGDQWGVVIDGKIDLTIGYETKTLDRGDTYFLRAGTVHRARMYDGFRGVDYVVDRNYRRAK